MSASCPLMRGEADSICSLRDFPPLTQSGPQPQRLHHGARLYLGVLTSSTPEASPLDSHSVSPALRAARLDRSGRPQGDNDIVEQYKNPSKELATVIILISRPPCHRSKSTSTCS